MDFIQRAYQGGPEQQSMAALACRFGDDTLHHPDYIPDLDLVTEAPDGQLAAFCVCWLKSTIELTIGQVEPLGVHPDFRRLGLGRAILYEGLRRLNQYGAEDIYVETDNYRNAALELYESAGFHVHRGVLVYRKNFTA